MVTYLGPGAGGASSFSDDAASRDGQNAPGGRFAEGVGIR